MHTITDILRDIDRGCMIHNLNENCFSYRIIFFVNERNRSSKHYTDTVYCDLRESLENIIRENLSLTNSVVIANTTVLKHRKCIRLQSKSYSFSLDEYFNQINGIDQNNNISLHFAYKRYGICNCK